jgi:small subunit ribosomal protein S20
MPAKKQVKKAVSILKRQRQNVKAHERNVAVKASVKTAVKKVRAAVEAKDPEAAKTALREAETALRKASSKGVLHKRNSSRRVARLAVMVAKAGAK